MPLDPSFAAFERLARGAKLVPVFRELLFDSDTAVAAYTKLARPPFGFLLESVVGGERWARYTFLGTEPRAAWRLIGDRIDRWTAAEGWSIGERSEDPLAELERIVRDCEPAHLPELPRFWGGAVGYFGYDIVRLGAALPDPPPDELGVPDALFMLTRAVLAIDNLFGRARIIVGVDTKGADAQELRRRYDEAQSEIDALIVRLREEPGPEPLALPAPAAEDPPFESNTTRDGFEAMVRRVQEAIGAGEVQQVVVSQRLRVPLRAPSFDLYRVLRALNPSPYLFYLDLDGFQLVGSSPEVLVRLEEGIATVRPIAGTRRRGASPEEDRELARNLLADPKERSEHLMLVELGEEDLARIAPRTAIRVPERMVVEKYSHVLHLVSTVEAEVEEGVGAIDVLRAAFPAGTVSGAPKLRAMQIIDELEPSRRGPYAGAVGYLASGARAMDFAIAIRTVVAKDGWAHLQAGAGVVAESNPAGEYEETLNKARALLRAVQMLEGAELEG